MGGGAVRVGIYFFFARCILFLYYFANLFKTNAQTILFRGQP